MADRELIESPGSKATTQRTVRSESPDNASHAPYRRDTAARMKSTQRFVCGWPAALGLIPEQIPGPTPPQSEAVLSANASFCQLGYGGLRPLRCVIESGTVTLSGQVQSYYLKQIAQTTAMNVPGVRRVRNDIVVIND